MKFANYKFYAKGINNLGDNIQIIALDYLYETMGIPKEDIIYIDTNELPIYEGEYVVLPVTMPLVNFTPNGIAGRFSDRIIPVFLGFTMVKDSLLPEEVEYLKRFSPIGCRDERTLTTVRNYGIESYLHGCITSTLPGRDKEGSFDKVIMVDAPTGIEKFIPDNLKSKLVYRTHMHENLKADPKELMIEYYKEYKESACLIITSLLHCSVPCIAAGIPVILAKGDKAVSYRFSWLEKLIHIYTLDEFDQINWNAQPIMYDEHKQRVEALTIKRLQDTFEKYYEILDLSYFYEMRQRKEYINDACKEIIDFIDTNWKDVNKEYKYAIWGLTQVGEYIYSYIQEKYKNAELCHVYDTYKQEKMCGLVSQHPQNIPNFKDELIIVATNGAINDVTKMKQQKGNEDLVFTSWNIVK